MKLHPMPGTVLLEYVEPVEERTDIVMPVGFPREEWRTGRIVAIGDPRMVFSDVLERLVEVPIDVRVGEYALFKPYTADVLSIAGRKLGG